ncbi:MAG: DUF3786 domain-containing protein [Chloroflexota bacterium]|nr:MAG: DUF3786 domain-containing protein [Chloroflexota bacterium]
MNNPEWIWNQSKPDLLANRIDELRSLLRGQDPEQLAERTGSTYQRTGKAAGEFHLQFWEHYIGIKIPEFVVINLKSGQEMSNSISLATLFYYFVSCDGEHPSGQWISFSDLPDGRFYNRAFQGYTGGQLAQAFSNDYDLFCQAAEKLGGKRVYLLGDAGFEFPVLPLVTLLLLTWRGDEDFNATYQILFDSAVSHHLPTDACAIIGSNLTQRMIVKLEMFNENRN